MPDKFAKEKQVANKRRAKNIDFYSVYMINVVEKGAWNMHLYLHIKN